MLSSSKSLSALALLITVLPSVSAQDICYDGFGRAYYCNGLSYAARIGIGIGIAVAVILLFSLCGYYRRKKLQQQFAKFRPPALPFQNQGGQQQQYSYGQGNNPYGNNNQYQNNPPPPQGYGQQNSSYGNQNPYGNNPPPPPATYQPSMAGQYGGGGGYGYQSRDGAPKSPEGGNDDQEHGYEWEQAREQERLERLEREQTGVSASHSPPGYDVSTAATTPVVTGNAQGGNDSFAPPPGAPPSKRT